VPQCLVVLLVGRRETVPQCLMRLVHMVALPAPEGVCPLPCGQLDAVTRLRLDEVRRYVDVVRRYVDDVRWYVDDVRRYVDVVRWYVDDVRWYVDEAYPSR